MANKNELSKFKKYFDQKMLIQAGFSYYAINRMIQQGKLKKINKGNYENLAYSGEEHDFYCVNAYIDEGVVCLMSAAVYYGLSNYRTHQIDVAIAHKTRIYALPEWPSIKLYYFSKNRFETGIKNIQEGENSFRIYDIEKTVCDLVAYRNKFGMEDSVEVLKNYLNRKDRNLNQLIDYAKQLKCYTLVSKYLEVLVG
jgi:predicted transcriptional regulator of viral defense system